MKHSKIFSVALALIVALTLVFAMSVTAFAEEAPADENAVGAEAAKTAESMARQPEAAGKINSAMMLGLVFIETAIIYALIIAILIIFVL